jgi:hypothetical protein
MPRGKAIVLVAFSWRSQWRIGLLRAAGRLTWVRRPAIHRTGVLIDMRYNPGRTVFVRTGARATATRVPGRHVAPDRRTNKTTLKR